jgi:hypothetical protein
VPAPAFSDEAQQHVGFAVGRRHRLMTYALMASKMATLIAIMIKKNFPIALPPADHNAVQQKKFSAAKRTRPCIAQRPAILAGLWTSRRDRGHIATP